MTSSKPTRKGGSPDEKTISPRATGNRSGLRAGELLGQIWKPTCSRAGMQEMEKIPLFMTKQPDGKETSPAMEAFQAMLSDDTPAGS